MGRRRSGPTLQTEEWLGPASTLLAEAVAPYVAGCEPPPSKLEQAASQARAAAAAYETAFAAIVPPPLIAANRARLTSLVTHNVFGQKHRINRGHRKLNTLKCGPKTPWPYAARPSATATVRRCFAPGQTNTTSFIRRDDAVVRSRQPPAPAGAAERNSELIAHCSAAGPHSPLSSAC